LEFLSIRFLTMFSDSIQGALYLKLLFSSALAMYICNSLDFIIDGPTAVVAAENNPFRPISFLIVILVDFADQTSFLIF
ncbi:hypothetical protein BB558_007083, partial [Smittium angustum]